MINSHRSSSVKYLDLRGVPCPVNYIRCSLFLEELEPNDSFHVDIDRGEPEDNVLLGLKGAGHDVEVILVENHWLRLKVICVAS